MQRAIQAGQKAFIDGSPDAIGSVRGLTGEAVVIYVENAGDFSVPIAALTGVHDGKVSFDGAQLDRKLLDAVRHSHDREDPNVAG